MDQNELESLAKSYTSKIQNYLKGKTNAQDTVESIITPIASSSQDEARDQLYTLWRVVLDEAESTPKPYDLDSAPTISNTTLGTLQKLLTLLNTIRKSPATLPDGTTQIAKLPEFGSTVRDYYRSPTDSPQTSADSWTGLNAFLAVLWTACDPASDYKQPEAYDYALYAIWSLRDALETEQDTGSLKILLPAAAAWIFIASRVVFESQRRFPASPKTGAPARAGPLLAEALKEQGKDPKEVDGFSGARWQFWKDRFVKITGDESVGGDIRSIAKAASDRMATQQ